MKIFITFALFYIFQLLSFGSSEFTLDLNDILNSDFNLFPNTTVFHQVDLVQSTLEHFIRLLNDDDLLQRAYTNFKVTFGERRALPSRGPFKNRIQVFKDNIIKIFYHNLRARMKMYSTYEMGVNQFADMPLDEFKEENLGLIISQDFSQTPKNLSIDSKSLPAKFDWSSKGVITAVRIQQICSSCVMFTTTAVLEALYAIQNNKVMVDLSEQHLLDCASAENGYLMNRGCKGNEYQDTFQFAMNHGLVSEHEYPYTGEQGECKSDFLPVTRLKSYERINSRPENLKAAVLNTGPVAIGITVYPQFRFYKEGIYDDCYSEPPIGGHTMAVVGFNDKGRGKYYRMKNQWSELWGERGFVRYTSTDPRCGVENFAFSLYI